MCKYPHVGGWVHGECLWVCFLGHGSGIMGIQARAGWCVCVCAHMCVLVVDECIFSTHNFSKQTSCSHYREHDLRNVKRFLEGISKFTWTHG